MSSNDPLIQHPPVLTLIPHKVTMHGNINSQVQVELTAAGADQHNRYIEKLYAPAKPPRSQPRYGEGAVLHMPLWELMQIFGPHMSMGMGIQHNLFKDNSVFITIDPV